MPALVRLEVQPDADIPIARDAGATTLSALGRWAQSARCRACGTCCWGRSRRRRPGRRRCSRRGGKWGDRWPMSRSGRSWRWRSRRQAASSCRCPRDGGAVSRGGATATVPSASARNERPRIPRRIGVLKPPLWTMKGCFSDVRSTAAAGVCSSLACRDGMGGALAGQLPT
ncbi:unnamed protein product [Phaeothamnion confervicola]